MPTGAVSVTPGLVHGHMMRQTQVQYVTHGLTVLLNLCNCSSTVVQHFGPMFAPSFFCGILQNSTSSSLSLYCASMCFVFISAFKMKRAGCKKMLLILEIRFDIEQKY